MGSRPRVMDFSRVFNFLVRGRPCCRFLERDSLFFVPFDVVFGGGTL